MSSSRVPVNPRRANRSAAASRMSARVRTAFGEARWASDPLLNRDL
jgi:hypothetical protein